jgi:hypothetical protein
MTGIPLAERGEHQRTTQRMVASASVIRECVDGVAFQLAAEDYQTAARFIALERLCCPFLRFTLDVAPGRGPVVLTINGPPGTLEFLQSELHLPKAPA